MVLVSFKTAPKNSQRENICGLHKIPGRDLQSLKEPKRLHSTKIADPPLASSTLFTRPVTRPLRVCSDSTGKSRYQLLAKIFVAWEHLWRTTYKEQLAHAAHLNTPLPSMASDFGVNVITSRKEADDLCFCTPIESTIGGPLISRRKHAPTGVQ
jgi:hypothetical protein